MSALAARKIVEKEDWSQLTDEFMEAIGSVLASERKHRRLNQEEAAQLSGLTRGTISDVEKARNGSHSTAYQYALGLGLRWSVIVARAEKQLADWRRDRGDQPVLELVKGTRGEDE